MLAYIISQPDLLHDYKGKLNKEHFRYPPAKFLFERFREKYDSHRMLPTLEECREVLARHPKLQQESSVVRAAVLGYVEDVYTREVTAITGEFLGSYIIRQELLGLEDTLANLKEVEDYPTLEKAIVETKERLQHLEDILHKKHRKGLTFPFEGGALEDFGRFIESSAEEAISSGLPEFDCRSRGGFRRGDVVLLSGQSGVGKTATMVSLSCTFVRSGLRVVYLALDNTERDILERCYSSFTGVKINDDSISISEYEQRVRIASKNIGTRMVVQHLPSKSIRIDEIRGILKDIRKELWLRDPDDTRIDVVVLDYDAKVNSSKNHKEVWYMLGENMDELTGQAQEEHCLYLVGSQQNEEGKEYGARSKRFPVAQCLALDQTPAEYHEGHLRLKVLKNRYGPTLFQIPLEICYENQRVVQRIGFDGVIPMGDPEPKRSYTPRVREFTGKKQELPNFDVAPPISGEVNLG